LAAKVEESPKKVRDIINVYYHLSQKRDDVAKPEPMDTNKQIYWDLKNEIIKSERHVLRELGFMVYVELPHKFILNYLKILEGSSELAQQAWNIINDSLRTIVCVRFKPEQIATSAVYMAARHMQIKLPEEPYPWWELFETSHEDIDEICLAISSLYSRQKAAYIDIKGIPSTPSSEPSTPVPSITTPPPNQPLSSTDNDKPESVPSSTTSTINVISPTSSTAAKRSESPNHSPRESRPSSSHRPHKEDKHNRDRDHRDKDYRERDREREKERDRERDRHREHERDKDRERSHHHDENHEERGRSSHHSSRRRSPYSR